MFLRSLPAYGPARDAYILGAIQTGNLDAPLWIDVQCGPVTLSVSADFLKIQGERPPMAAPVAQAAVDALGALLPTPRIVEAIEAAARERGRLIPFVPWPHWQDNSQLETSTILWREGNIPEVQAGTLIAGCLKDVVIAPRLAKMPGKVLIFGGIYADGRRVQLLQTNTAHHAGFDGGYAHGVRAIRDACLVNGQPARVSEILKDPARASWLSSEGALTVVRYPTATTASEPVPTSPTPAKPSPTTAPATTATWTLPEGTTLRRGHRGPLVAELQRLLARAGFSVARDSLFGNATEAAVIELQSERGLDVDGVVGPQTRKALGWVLPEDEDTEPGEAEPEYPFVQAKNYYVGRQKPIRLVVIHTAEIAEVANAAENLAAWAAGPNAPMASWHFAVDADSVVQCVREEDTAFAAPGANADGCQVELAGRAGQGTAGWADHYSQAVLRRAATLVAGLCRRHGLPVEQVDAAGLLRGEKGITGHHAVTLAYRRSTHTDPGVSFPWDAFLAMVRAA